jgi:hypothetical protein
MLALRKPLMFERLKIRSATDLYLIFVAVVLPWQNQQVWRKGVTVFHVLNGILVCAMLVAFMVRGPRPRWFLIVPMYVYWFGSFLGMFNSEAYMMNIYTLTQDAYLYVWFVFLCVFLDSEERVERLVVAWVLVLILVLSTEGFLANIQGTQRGEFSFRNPNRASAYLTLTFFLLLHPVVPLPLKAILGLLVFSGVRATGSAAGSIGLTLAMCVFGWSILYMRSARMARPLLLLGIVAMALFVVVMNPTKSSDLPTVLGSLAPTAAGRIERSSETREEIWAKGMESFREHPLGIGPASFHKQVDTGISADGRIELHSDPVATVVERGVVGFMGYILLIVFVGRELFRMMHRSSEWREVIWGAALAGACSVYFFYSITHEALHHETFWLMIALIFSQVRILEKKRSLDPIIDARRFRFAAKRIRAIPVGS